MASAHLAAPYWGPIDAAHQFCEAKYAVSPFVAEFWNAISNVPCFIIPGLYGLYRGRSDQDLRLKLIWAHMALVGLGSLMFHGTMRFKWELLDEVPMVMLVLCGVLSKDDVHWLTRGIWKVLVHSVVVSISVVGLYLYISRGAYEIFLHTFTAVVILDLALTCICTAKPDRHGSWVAQGCILAYIITIGAGRLFWEAEVRFCPAGSGGLLAWLHVLWHVLAGLACYFGALGDAHARFAVLGVGRGVDAPGATWPLIWALGGYIRPNGCSPAGAFASIGKLD